MSTNNNEQNTANFNLNRFVAAQENVYTRILAELKNGDKQSHWMWFIFPQIDGLGTSTTAKLYAIKSIEEAKAYYNHPLLGKRLLECAAILLTIKNKSANDILGSPDYVKLQSCITLFSHLFPDQNILTKLLTKYYDGKIDTKTIDILNLLK